MTGTIQKLDQSSTPASSIPKVIVRAEPTLARILKTLDADYVKVQVRRATYCLLWLTVSCFMTKNKLTLSLHFLYLICVRLFSWYLQKQWVYFHETRINTNENKQAPWS
jgi:hypothetical protein